MLGNTGSFNQQINGLTPDENKYDPDGFFNTYGLDIAQWEANFTEIEGRSSKTIRKYLDAYKERVDSAPEKNDGYANIIFAQLFLHYVT